VLLSEPSGDTGANVLCLPLDAAVPALRRELAIMVLHSLHALIMHNLMGGEEP
jgi:hypothetical protein